MKNNKNYDSPQTHLFTSFPNSQAEDMTELLTNEKDYSDDNLGGNLEITDQTPSPPVTNFSIWQLEYYQKYFDVDTNEVLLKVTGSIVPTFNQNYFLNRIRPNPDLYGPFWIAMTLVFSIAISGNFVSFMQSFGSDFKWHTDFHKVTTSAAAILTYWWLVPTALYFIQKWRQQQQITQDGEGESAIDQTIFTFIELLSIYGYSLFVYIPCSILWMINIGFIQWSLVLIAIGLSETLLFFNLWPSLNKGANKQVGIAVMSMVIVLNALLGLSFMLYFFHDPSGGSVVPPSVVTTTTTGLPSTTISSNATLVV